VAILAKRAQVGHVYSGQRGENSSKDEDKLQTQSYILSLPFELRRPILNHVCRDRNKNKNFSGTLYSLYVHSPQPEYLHLVCLQVRDEMIGGFYQSRTFVTLLKRARQPISGAMAFPRNYVGHIQRLELHYHLPKALISNHMLWDIAGTQRILLSTSANLVL
jgi:hypothetical protein